MSDDFRLVIRRTGGPEVIERDPIDTPPEPGACAARVRQQAIGVNFIDTYHRSGLYALPLPSGLGGEAAGVIEAIGPGVTDLHPGDRVAYVSQRPGSYATVRVLPVKDLVRLPETVNVRDAAATMLKGLTADMLVGECGRVQAGMTVLVHAAGGGVGSLLVQWLKAIGATVIAHAGSAAKAAHAETLGADHAIAVPLDLLGERVRDLTHGRGVEVVLDGVGKASWAASLAAVARRGLIVTYGNASGPAPSVAPLELAKAGSIFLTRPTLYDYIETRERLEAASARLFAMLASGKVKAEIGQTFPLADAAEAHRALEARTTQGATVLLP